MGVFLMGAGGLVLLTIAALEGWISQTAFNWLLPVPIVVAVIGWARMRG